MYPQASSGVWPRGRFSAKGLRRTPSDCSKKSSGQCAGSPVASHQRRSLGPSSFQGVSVCLSTVDCGPWTQDSGPRTQDSRPPLSAFSICRGRDAACPAPPYRSRRAVSRLLNSGGSPPDQRDLHPPDRSTSPLRTQLSAFQCFSFLPSNFRFPPFSVSAFAAYGPPCTAGRCEK